MLELVFFDFLISSIFSGVLFYALKYLGFNDESIYFISLFAFMLFFMFSIMFSFYIQKIKKQIIFLSTQVEKLKKFDEITDVYNRDFLLENLKKYFYISKRKNIPLSIMVIDIDNFKKINEIEGFEKGNVILKQTSEILRDNIRGMDIVGRYGSDEFLIASFSTKDEIYNLASRINKILKDELNLSVSIGIAQREKLDKLEDVLRKAHEAVYLAQKKGGSRVDVLEHFLLVE